MNHFSEIAKDWDTPQTLERNKIFSDALTKYVPNKTDLELLDFGCGTGLLSESFALRADKLLGIDTTKEMLEIFDKRFKNLENTQSLCVNLEETPESLGDRFFDVIYTAMAFHHLKRPQRTLELFKKHLKNGGKVAVIDLDQEDGSFHPDNKAMGVHHYGFGRIELQSWADELKFKNFDHDIIHSIDKNGRIYRVALSLFSL
jgi:ubiquinone/menaquinone biosynthesis C-methylase UbiE